MRHRVASFFDELHALPLCVVTSQRGMRSGCIAQIQTQTRQPFEYIEQIIFVEIRVEPGPKFVRSRQMPRCFLEVS